MSVPPSPPTLPFRLRAAVQRFAFLTRQHSRNLALHGRTRLVQLRGQVHRQTGILQANFQRFFRSISQCKLSLNRQLSFILVGMSLFFVAGSYLIQTSVVMPTFESLERQGAVEDVNRCVSSLKRDLDLLGDLSNDWAAWDDTYRFIEDRNDGFRETNLTKEACESARISLLAMVNANRELTFGDCFDPETMERMEMPGLWSMLTSATFPLTQHRHIGDRKGGLLLTSAGPLLLYASPILTSKREGPMRGSVIMGRFLVPSEIEDLAKRAEVKMDALVIDQSSLKRGESTILEELRETGTPVVKAEHPGTLLAYAMFNDLYGQPGLLFRVKAPREVTARGKLAANVATLGSILGSLAVMAGVGFLIRRRVVAPLEAIVVHARRVGSESDLKARLNSKREDEIGELAQAFDQMVECLALSRKKVLEAAHKAGMADVASEVLHNVGNVINSANASVEQLEEELQNSKVVGLEKAAVLLEAHKDSPAEFFTQDPRGPKLISYLIKISSVLRNECTQNQERLNRVRKSMRHIQEIVALQEQRAHQAGFVCETALEESLREVVALNQDRLDRAGIDVRVQTEPLPDLLLNGSKLLQVLMNLVRNAIQAMDTTPPGSRKLSLTARRSEDGCFELSVKDAGCGMPEEVQSSLFQHGFTTKVNGQGIGLHYCANAVRSMGGSILAVSDGPGQGATIIIRLPGGLAVESAQPPLKPAKAA